MRDHSHISTEHSDVCAHCGHVVVEHVPSFGAPRTNRTGLAVTLLLHALLLLIFFLHRNVEKHARPPSGATMIYISPLAGKPKQKQQQQAPKKTVKQARVNIQRLPNTITLPHEKPVEVVQEEPKKVSPQPEETDMQAYIEARKKARGAQAPSDQSSEESADARADRIAKANIAAANGRSRGDDKNESGGVFSLSNQTFHSADLKFRGWNPNFKRRWLTQLTVERGSEVDVETAVIKRMIELIRKEKVGDFEWDSQRLGHVVTLSARVQDTAELQAFLFKEMFPTYRPSRQ